MPRARTMTSSRAVPVDPGTAFDRTLVVPLPEIFDRWYGPIAPVAQVRGGGPVWGTVGQTRTVVQAAGSGTFLETLTAVDRPHRFTYRLTEPTGPVKGLIAAVDGAWDFAPAGTGCEITWTWTVEPSSPVAAALLPGFARLWQGFARQGLERLSRHLLA